MYSTLAKKIKPYRALQACLVLIFQRVKHSKLADGIDHAITEEKKFIPPGVDAEQVGGAGG